jgi:TRAP-type transport system periplasmic protein
MTVHELSAEEQAKLRERAQPVINKFTKEIGEALVQEARTQIAQVRAAK